MKGYDLKTLQFFVSFNLVILIFLDEELKPVHLKRLDVSLDPTKKEERIKKVKESMQTYRERYGGFRYDKAYQSMFNLLWYSQLPCNDISGITSSSKDESSFVKRCYWKKNPISCNAIFQKRPTDGGMCCSFNIEKAEKILKESQYTNAIAARQRFDSKNAFETNRKPNWYEKNNEPKTKAGIENGLTLVFDAHSDRISSGSVVDNFRGVPILVDGQNKFPMIKMSGIRARSGFENSVSINAIDVQALDEIRRHPPEKRKCYFPDEYELDMHQKYSQPSCTFECEIKFAAKCISTCKNIDKTCDCSDESFIKNLDLKSLKSCIPWFYPLQDGLNLEMCDPWMTNKFKNILAEKIPMNLCDHCLEDCSSTTYQTSISYTELQECDDSNIGSIFCDLTEGELNPAPWTSDAQNEYLSENQSIPWFLDTNGSQTETGRKMFSDKRSRFFRQNNGKNAVFADKMKMNPYYNAFEKDIGILNVFFAEKKVTKYVKANKGTYFDFVSMIGGSLGGFMGISILSAVEIFYWIFFRLYGRMF